MAFDFPNPPLTVGQTFSPPGGPTYTWNGTAWLLPAGGSGGGGASVTISDTSPTPAQGALWWQSNTGTFWISYNDGNSVQWVALNGLSSPNMTGVLNVQVFTASGTYTPVGGMATAIIECVGGGAGGASIYSTTATIVNAPGGGAGAYSRKLVTAAQVGASQVVTIGVGGTGATVPAAGAGTTGGAGGDTSVGSLCVARGAPASGTGSGQAVYGGSPGGPATGIGDIVVGGSPSDGGSNGPSTGTAGGVGAGASSYFGGGGRSNSWASTGPSIAGNAATGYGSGGSGTSSNSATSGAVGGNGSSGIVIITEYAAVTPSGAGIAPAPGTRVLLFSQSVAPASPVASVNWFYNFATAPYDQYEIDVYDVQLSTTANYLVMRVSTDGSTFDTGANYSFVNTVTASNQTNPILGAATTVTYIAVMVQSDPTAADLGTTNIRFSMPWVSDRIKVFMLDGTGYGATYNLNRSTGAGVYAPLTPLRGIQLYPAVAANITRGVFNIYGIAKAGSGGT